MAVSSHPDHFFQTTSSISNTQRKTLKSKNKQGSPIQFPTKILGIQRADFDFDTSGDTVFVVEAGGILSAVKLSTGAILKVGNARETPAPLTCLTSHTVSVSDGTRTRRYHDIYTGGWDKCITRYRVDLSELNQTAQSEEVEGGGGGKKKREGKVPVTQQVSFKAHQDFVKCVLIARTADNIPVLISGGADAEINIWDVLTIGNNNGAPTRLATLQPQSRSIECLVVDPLFFDASSSHFSNTTTTTSSSKDSSPSSEQGNKTGDRIFFSTSQREIFTFVLPPFSKTTSTNIQNSLSPPLIIHETSVYNLHFDSQGDLWTASADKTAKHLLRSDVDTDTANSSIDPEFSVDKDMTLQHPDFVRSTITHPNTTYVITACRDENLRIFDRNTEELVHVYEGHFEEVTCLAVVGSWVVSGSIDATVRKWSLRSEDLLVDIERSQNKKKEGGVGEGMVGEDGEDGEERGGDKEEKGMQMTAEEEAELEALMMDDSD